jgi:hypothetical protein
LQIPDVVLVLAAAQRAIFEERAGSMKTRTLPMGLLAFFIGTALSVLALASAAGPFRWPALGFGLGASLILGEIILAQVLLSQIGNILILLAGIAFARPLLRGRGEAPV